MYHTIHVLPLDLFFENKHIEVYLKNKISYEINYMY